MPATTPEIRALAGFIPGHALFYGAIDGPATAIDLAHPLPTTALLGASSSTPLAGSINASTTVGPFAPQLGRPVWLTLSGSWTGSVQVLRSTDGGTTKLPITFGDGSAKGAFGSNVNAPVTEETVASASYYLAVTLGSGSLSYRLEQ